MAPKPPPSSRGDVDPEVTFSWPGQRRRPDPGVLETRLAQRRQRQQPGSRGRPDDEPVPATSRLQPTIRGEVPARAQPPARREDVSQARDRWVVTELRRQAMATDASLRDMTERIDQLGRMLRQVVDYLPRLQRPAAAGAPTAGKHADAVLSQRIDEFEARIEARFDELAGAASAMRAGRAAGGRGPALDADVIKAQVHEAMAEVTAQLTAMGERLRAELVTAAGQAEARINRDRDQLRETLNQTLGKLGDVAGGAVSRDDLRQYWVEMAAKLAKQQEVVVSERQQLRQDLAERLDQIAADRQQLRAEVGERLARVAEAAAVRDRGTAADTKPIAAASAAQKAAIDELRRELNQLGAQLLAATNPRTAAKAPALDDGVVEGLRESMAQAAAALASAASKDDVEALRNQLAGTVSRLERALVNRVEQDQDRWEEQLETALEALRLAVEGVELNRQTVLAEVSAAVRAALAGVLPPLAGS
ncbi:MAG: hypothetical protein JO265_07850 [Acidimicrobiia bacterium]|nr:hypothetical protein [Acidimicrobiia bacterium]